MKKEEIKILFYQAHKIMPKAITDRADKLIFNFKDTITPEGNVNAYGVKESITGTHLDFVFLDDFVTIDDKISKAERDKTKIMIEEIVANILDPGAGVGFIGTPWHKDDAWKQCPKPIQYDCYNTGLMTEEQILEKRSSTTNITFAANYELRHVSSEDAMFKNPKFDRWNFRMRKGRGHIDKAYFGEDTTAVTFAEKKPNGRYQVIGWVYKDNIKYIMDKIAKTYKKYYIGTVYSEDNDDKGFASDQLREHKIRVSTYHENMNKHVKIQTYLLENGFWDLIDFEPDTDPEYLNQILDYVEGGEPDDAVDSLASLGRILIGKSTVYTDRWKK